MRVLVTGGAGYVGSHVVFWLADHGHEPIVFDNLSSGHERLVRAPLIRGDLCDIAAVDRAFAEAQPEAVMHFAARSLVGESMRDPQRYFRHNVVGALNLLDTMLARGVKRVIFSSSAAVYGVPLTTPIVEQSGTVPINPYGDSKLAIERMLFAYSQAYGIRFAALRYFNAAGAAPEQGLGELHDPETHLIPIVLQVPLGQRAAVSIFGDDYPTADGTCIRDYIHVLDLADAHHLALMQLVARDESLVLNLGSGSGYSVRQVLAAARRVTGHPIEAKSEPRRAGDPPILVADAARAREVLGWCPRYGLDEMVASAWEFYRLVSDRVEC